VLANLTLEARPALMNLVGDLHRRSLI